MCLDNHDLPSFRGGEGLDTGGAGSFCRGEGMGGNCVHEVAEAFRLGRVHALLDGGGGDCFCALLLPGFDDMFLPCRDWETRDPRQPVDHAQGQHGVLHRGQLAQEVGACRAYRVRSDMFTMAAALRPIATISRRKKMPRRLKHLVSAPSRRWSNLQNSEPVILRHMLRHADGGHGAGAASLGLVGCLLGASLFLRTSVPPCARRNRIRLAAEYRRSSCRVYR